MKLVSSRAEVLANVNRLSSYLAQRSGSDAEFVKALIQRGICFVVVDDEGNPFFAPSRFVGYVDNSRQAHIRNHDKDGRETNKALAGILGPGPNPDARLEREYQAFCARSGITPNRAGSFGVFRKFWDLR